MKLINPKSHYKMIIDLRQQSKLYIQKKLTITSKAISWNERYLIDLHSRNRSLLALLLFLEQDFLGTRLLINHE